MILQLDPPAVAAVGRTAFDLDTGPVRVAEGGVDWGQAAIDAYLADRRWGSVPVDFRVPNRVITIPLGLGMDDSGQEEAVRNELEKKVALFHAEGGTLLRQRVAAGSPPLYADVVDAALTVPDVWGEEGGIEPDVTLVLTCLPDFYGDEVTLDAITGTGLLNAVLKSGGAQATIKGHYPGRARLIVSDTSGNDQLGMIWGLRSRHYDAATTAKLFYEAESLTPLSGATVSALAGASGGSRVQLASLVGGAWVPVLSTQASGGGAQMSHVGSYRVWARAYSATATPSLRMLWAVGDLANPIVNDAVQLPGAGAFYLVDLGEIRIDAPPVGVAVWQGVIQAMGAADGDPVSIDCLYLQPLDESAGYLQAVQPTNLAGTIADGPKGPTAAADATGIGTAVWANPANVEASDGVYAVNNTISLGVTSHYLQATGFGFNIPAGATINGIQVAAVRYGAGKVVDVAVRLVKAGVIQATDRADTIDIWPSTPATKQYGGAADLWGGAWAVADINNAGFGAALAVTAQMGGGNTAFVDYVSITVYFTLASGFTVAQEAVMYANRTLELRHDGAWRQDPSGSQYGPAPVPIVDLPRLPTSGLEGRAVELFAKRSRGDIFSKPDSGLDAGAVTVKYRPCYLDRI